MSHLTCLVKTRLVSGPTGVDPKNETAPFCMGATEVSGRDFDTRSGFELVQKNCLTGAWVRVGDADTIEELKTLTTSKGVIDGEHVCGVGARPKTQAGQQAESRFPVTVIKWQEARDYCRSRGGDLPTGDQWSKACGDKPYCTASGVLLSSEARFDADYADYEELQDRLLRILRGTPSPSKAKVEGDSSKKSGPVSVNSFEGNVFEIKNLTGNVAEWTLDDVGGAKVVRGGSWGQGAEELYAALHETYPPDFEADRIGFRCVYPPRHLKKTPLPRTPLFRNDDSQQLKQDNPIHEILAIEEELATPEEMEAVYHFVIRVRDEVQKKLNDPKHESDTTVGYPPNDVIRTMRLIYVVMKELAAKVSFGNDPDDPHRMLTKGLEHLDLGSTNTSFLVSSVAHELGYPVSLVVARGGKTYVSLRGENESNIFESLFGTPLNWMLDGLPANDPTVQNGVYLRSLTPKERTAIVLVNRAYARPGVQWDEESLPDLDKAIELFPKYVEAWSARAGAKADLGKYAEALRDYDQAIKLDPFSANLFVARGQIKRDLGQEQEAIRDFDRALAIYARHEGALCGRGLAKISLGKKEEAEANFKAFREIDATRAAGCVFHFWEGGHTKFDEGKYDGAIGDLNWVIVANPENGDALITRGKAKIALGRTKEAIADFEEARKVNPSLAETQGRLFRNDGDKKLKEDEKEDEYEKAIRDYNFALVLNPRDAWALIGRGRAYLFLDKEEAAKADFEEARKADLKVAERAGRDFRRDADILFEWVENDDIFVLDSRVILYEKALKGKNIYEMAIQYYNWALMLNPFDSEAFAARGRAQKALDKTKE